MEQRIGSSSQPLEGAGFDPAFIPGLTSPASGEPADADPADGKSTGAKSTEAKSTEAVETEEAAPEKTADADEPEASEESEESEASEESEETGESDEAEEAGEAGETPDGPVFEASDRRAKIVADHRGVRLALDDQSCEFRWDEIGAVETEIPRFGKRFTITVHTPDRRWYPIEIEATARSRFTEWESQLDAVLDAYFDEDAAEVA